MERIGGGIATGPGLCRAAPELAGLGAGGLILRKTAGLIEQNRST